MKRLVAIGLCILMLAGSFPQFTASAEESRQSDVLTLRVAIQDDMKSLNPIIASDEWTWKVLSYIYGSTMNVDSETKEFTPYIAVGSANESTKSSGWTWDDCSVGNFNFNRKDAWNPASVYGEAVIFYDFDNVKWHDGTQMTIRDVMFSMHMAAQVPEWSSSMNPLKDMSGSFGTNYSTTGWLHAYKVWESADQKQAALKFVLQSPYAGFFRDTLSTFLLPYHIWGYKVSGQAVDGAKIWCDPGFSPTAADSWKAGPALAYSNNPPIGSGPFKFEFRDVGSFIKVLTFRDHFFKTGYKYTDHVLDEYGESLAVMPRIEAITYKIFKTNDAAILALKNNDIDYIAWSLPSSMVQDISQVEGIEMVFSMDPDFYYLAYNMRLSSFGYVNGSSANGDAGKIFRRVVAHCIDKNRIVSVLMSGLGVPADGPVNSLDKDWYDKDYIIRYYFDPTEAKTMLANAGYKVRKSNGDIVSGQDAINAAGADNWWVNPDESPIGSGNGGKIEILNPDAYYDPIRAQAGLMIAEQLRNVGIYAESLPMDFGSIVDRIDNRMFDMYILGWNIGSEPPDYLWAFFHSSNSQVGQNYPGYQNASFDALIDGARNTGDSTERRRLVLESLTALTYDLPYDVLYYRTNVEAYRSDRFTGWVVNEYGTIFNWESLKNLRPVGAYRVSARFITLPSAMASSGTGTVTVQVRDPNLTPAINAEVWLDAPTGGTFAVQQGVTDANGIFTTQFTAPFIPMPDASDPYYSDIILNGTTIQITARATYTDPTGFEYDQSPIKIAEIKVYPETAPFITITMNADPDIIEDVRNDSPGLTFVEVSVRDQNSDPVADAAVNLSIFPEMPAIDEAEQKTDSSGKAIFRVTAADLPSNDDSIHTFTLSAEAVHPTDPNITTRNELALNVIDKMPPPPEPPGEEEDDDNDTGTLDTGKGGVEEFLWVLLPVAAVAAVAATAASLAMKRRRGSPPPPEHRPPAGKG